MKTASGTVHIKNVKYDSKAHIWSRRKYKSDEEIFINLGSGRFVTFFSSDTNINYKEKYPKKQQRLGVVGVSSRQKGKQKGTE